MSERRVVIAPDKFKGTLTAMEVAQALAAGIGNARLAPLADGGDGSVDAAVRAGFERRTVTVRGSFGEPVIAPLAVKDDTVLVEAAAICGLGERRDPLAASTFGVGEAILHALDWNPKTIVLAAGGTGTVDGGAGMLAALDGRVPEVELVLASDVDNPLIDAATVYGPQKGAGPAEVAVLVERLTRLAQEHPELASRPGAGAAGGLGFAAFQLGARYRPGAEFFLDLADLDLSADLVITGEGSLDAQTLSGKLPLAVARRSNAPVIAVVGRCLLTSAETRAAGFAAVYALADRDPRCANDPDLSRRLLTEIGRELELSS
ncbi:glycerate kinase [Lentzea sp. NPDC034063]|uniref:glycerate kinase n=1 Tax=unclassified Lentzea TaxID=2643253 RepID=UPI0033D53B04